MILCMHLEYEKTKLMGSVIPTVRADASIAKETYSKSETSIRKVVTLTIKSGTKIPFSKNNQHIAQENGSTKNLTTSVTTTVSSSK